MKKILFSILSLFGLVAAFNMHSIQASAEWLYPSGQEVSFDQLKVGDVFYSNFEDSEPLIYRVIRTGTTKKPGIEIEVAGINPSYDWSKEESKYFDRNNLYIGIDDESMEEYAPYTIVGIADNAFKDDKTIKGFDTHHAHIRYIGKSAFEGCTNLQYFGSYKYLSTISDKAFYNCEKLKYFQLQNVTLKNVGTNALKNTNSKIKVITYDMSIKQASKINKLFKKAGANFVYFSMDTQKKESKKIKIPTESDVVIKLPKGATFSANSYTYRVLKPATKKHRGEVEITGFSDSPNLFDLEDVSPDEYVDEIGYERYDIVGIADNAFKGNQTIEELSVLSNNKFRYIGKSAFEGCPQLKGVFFAYSTNLSKIKAKAFYNCSSLKEMILEGNCLNKVGKDAFWGTHTKMKITGREMSSVQYSKVTQLIKKAGVKKARFHRKSK